MAYETEAAPRIPYDEYRAITALMHAHLQTHAGRLRALIVFGDLVTRGGTYDIDLLEVVEGWQGQNFVTFFSSLELPLRGQLRLRLLTPEEFEETANGRHLSEEHLLDRVQEGYEIVYEDPPGYARNVFAGRAKNNLSSSPLDFLVSGNTKQRP